MFVGFILRFFVTDFNFCIAQRSNIHVCSNISWKKQPNSIVFVKASQQRVLSPLGEGGKRFYYVEQLKSEQMHVQGEQFRDCRTGGVRQSSKGGRAGKQGAGRGVSGRQGGQAGEGHFC